MLCVQNHYQPNWKRLHTSIHQHTKDLYYLWVNARFYLHLHLRSISHHHHNLPSVLVLTKYAKLLLINVIFGLFATHLTSKVVSLLPLASSLCFDMSGLVQLGPTHHHHLAGGTIISLVHLSLQHNLSYCLGHSLVRRTFRSPLITLVYVSLEQRSL